MKRYIFLSIVFYLLVLQDSRSQNLLEVQPLKNFYSQRVMDVYKEEPLNLVSIPVGNYTASSFYYQQENGDFREGNAPEGIRTFGVNTNGIFRTDKNIIFFGQLDIQKSYYENLKWNLSYTLPEDGVMDDPHYFGVQKGASWDNQKYQIRGGVLLPLNSKFHLKLSTTYVLNNRYRVELDPRPEIKLNELGFSAGISYWFHSSHFFKLSGSYQYSHINNEIDFSNRKQNIPANYDIYVKWISGLGAISSPMNNTTQRRYKQYQLNLGYNYTTTSLQNYLDISYKLEKQITYRNSSVRDFDDAGNFFATYDPQVLRLQNLTIYQLTNDLGLRLTLAGQTKFGSNFLQSKGGKTYSLERNEISTSLGILKKKNMNEFTDLGLDFTFLNIGQEDGLTATVSEISTLNSNLYFMKSFQLSPKLTLVPFIKSGMKLNLDSFYFQGNSSDFSNLGENDFSGLTQKAFFDEVISLNHEFMSTNSINLELGSQFYIKRDGDFDISLNISGGYIKPVEELHYFDSSVNRVSANFSLTLSY